MLQNSSHSNLLSNVTASDNGSYGIFINASLSNTFSGVLQVGTNRQADCYVSNSTDPGLLNGSCANQGNSDAFLTTGVSVASSFVDKVNDDYTLLASDTVNRAALTLPTGNDTIAHVWSDAGTTVMLRNAVEIQGDGIGNDNLLCEEFETCLFTPNIAAYQGHGNLVSSGTFVDGILRGITLMQYETNGF